MLYKEGEELILPTKQVGFLANPNWSWLGLISSKLSHMSALCDTLDCNMWAADIYFNVAGLANSCQTSQWFRQHLILWCIVIMADLLHRVFPLISFSHQVGRAAELPTGITASTDCSGLIFFESWLVWSPCTPGTLQGLLLISTVKHQLFRPVWLVWANPDLI